MGPATEVAMVLSKTKTIYTWTLALVLALLTGTVVLAIAVN
jgi:hypothetical protein